MANRNILLIEPGYKNKHPPLGLMKIAQYHGPQGKRDTVRYVKGEDESVFGTAWDRVYITTLFSFEYRKIGEMRREIGEPSALRCRLGESISKPWRGFFVPLWDFSAN